MSRTSIQLLKSIYDQYLICLYAAACDERSWGRALKKALAVVACPLFECAFAGIADRVVYSVASSRRRDVLAVGLRPIRIDSEKGLANSIVD
jgi:hypothetical protein